MNEMNENKMNGQETEAEGRGYFRKGYLDSYPELHSVVRNKKDMNTGYEKFYWSAFGKFLYMVFENLYYLHNQYTESLKNEHTVNSHLPTFMSTYLMGYPIEEYLRSMIYFRGMDPANFSENRFNQVMNYPKDKKEKEEEFSKFFNRVSIYNNFNDIQGRWNAFKNQNGFRNELTHRYRFLWWKRGNSGPFGFPAKIQNNPNKVIWESISKADWEESFQRLSESEFISGGKLIEKLHADILEMVNFLFSAFTLDINSKSP